jgi:hypothetical protein
MTFLPIVTRELRIRARWKSTYWWRCGAALAASAIAVTMMLVGLVVGPGKAGQPMFVALSWVAFVSCLIEGVRNTADCLSEEKREGTLGLLFLTDLKGYDVVMGKFAATSVGAFFAFLATLPLLGWSLLLGGVTAGEFWRMCLALTSTLFFSLTAGLFVSALSRQDRQAWFGSIALVGFFTLALPLAGYLVSPLAPVKIAPSPWTLFSHAFDTGYVTDPGAYWTAAILVNLLGWLWLVLASVMLPRAWQEKALRTGLTRRFLGSAGARFSVRDPVTRARLLTINPLFWLAARAGQHGRLLWLVVVPASATAMIVAGVFLDQPGVLLGAWGCSLGLKAIVVLWVAWEACHSFGTLRQSGTLELLLVAPLRVAQVVQGEELALRRLFFGPVALLGGTELAIFTVQCLYQLGRGSGSDPAVVIFGGILLGSGLAVWVLDMMAVAHVGLWMSLVSQRPTQAWARTILLVLAAPLLLSVMPGIFCCGVTAPVMLVAKDIAFISWAQGKLRTDFRRMAARQPVTRF